MIPAGGILRDLGRVAIGKAHELRFQLRAHRGRKWVDVGIWSLSTDQTAWVLRGAIFFPSDHDVPHVVADAFARAAAEIGGAP